MIMNSNLRSDENLDTLKEFFRRAEWVKFGVDRVLEKCSWCENPRYEGHKTDCIYIMFRLIGDITSSKREELAAYAHDAWSGWMDYIFSKGIFHDDGTWTMPAWAAERWRRQAATSYKELPETEKEADRVEANEILSILAKYE